MSLALDFCDVAVPGVRDLQPYQPGKPIEELQRELGLTHIVKLASNENPLGPSPLALHCIRWTASWHVIPMAMVLCSKLP